MKKAEYFMPAEWAEQQFVQLIWPDEHTDWRPYLALITRTMVSLAGAITRYEDVLVAARDALSTYRMLNTALSAEQMARITVVDCPVNDTWARDSGGISLISARGRQILDFRFNGWGGQYPSADDNLITQRLHNQGFIAGELIDNNDFVLEGGSIESDGEGTIFTTTCCLLDPHRNGRLSQGAIERELKKRLHAKRIIWLRNGRLRGDDTGGHIDTIVRLAPNGVLLYVKPDAGDEHYAEFSALETELQTLRQPSGEPYSLLPLPLPRPVIFDGERLPATYANFLVINGAVIVPVYGQSDLDSEACRQISRAFPQRAIVSVDASVIIRQHGSIHCLTMQYPKIPNTENF
ncbi:MAG: agmatine deiminase family protein [Prevotella sp.]|nr:agmatine deiminase family protein [Prevotella sp.]